MTSFYCDYRINSTTEQDIYDHLIECNDYFSPKLSDKVDIQEYTHKIWKNTVRFEAILDSQLIGLVAAYANDPSKKCAFITNVSTLPVYFGKGIGKKLLSQCISYARKMEFRLIRLEVSVHSSAAISLYKTMGFETYDGTTTINRLQFNLNDNSKV